MRHNTSSAFFEAQVIEKISILIISRTLDICNTNGYNFKSLLNKSRLLLLGKRYTVAKQLSG